MYIQGKAGWLSFFKPIIIQCIINNIYIPNTTCIYFIIQLLHTPPLAKDCSGNRITLLHITMLNEVTYYLLLRWIKFLCYCATIYWQLIVLILIISHAGLDQPICPLSYYIHMFNYLDMYKHPSNNNTYDLNDRTGFRSITWSRQQPNNNHNNYYKLSRSRPWPNSLPLF